MPANKFSEYVKANAGKGMDLKAIAAQYRAEGLAGAARAKSQCYKLPQDKCLPPCRYVKASSKVKRNAYCALTPTRKGSATSSAVSSAATSVAQFVQAAQAAQAAQVAQLAAPVAKKSKRARSASSAPRVKSKCAGLTRDNCLPPDCLFTNGKLRQYCTVKRVLTPQQREILIARLAQARAVRSSSSSGSSSSSKSKRAVSPQEHDRRAAGARQAMITKMAKARQAATFATAQGPQFYQLAGAPRAKSACVGLAKEACLPPNCRYANGKIRQYCGAVPAARTKQQKDAAVQKAMITKMAKARQASTFATAQQFAGAPRAKSACVGLAKEACLPPNCRYANGKIRQYCGAVPAARTKQQKDAAVQKAMITKMAKARQASTFATAQQFAGAPRAKSACVGLPKDKCLPPACRFTNGAQRKYCGAVPAPRTKQQKDAAVQKAMITKMAKARQASTFATAQQYAGACGAW